jgi:hypothetical protein
MNRFPYSVRQVLFIKSVLSIDQRQSFYRFLINSTEMTVPQTLATSKIAVPPQIAHDYNDSEAKNCVHM